MTARSGGRSGRPNILFIMADQMTPFMLEVYGRPEGRTPALARLAERGALFTSAYTPSPICVPARAALMTGLQASATGSYDNGDPFPGFVPTVAHYLTNAGYDTALSGKMHFIGADQLRGFRRRLNTDIYPAGFIWSYPLLDRDDPGAMAFDFAPQYMAQNIGPGWCKELQYDEETQFRALEYLRHAPEDPFFLVVSFTSPHPPYVVPRRYWEMYRDAEVTLPDYPADMDARYSELDRAFLRWYGLDRKSIRDPEHLRAMRRGFCALSHYVDDKVAELLDVLDETGLRDDTVVMFTADHGEMLGEKGLIQKRSLYEWSTRVPMIVDLPGEAARRLDTPVSLLDLSATLLDIAGAEPATPLHGRSLMPALRGEALAERPVVSEYHGEGIMKPCFAVRRGRWKYIYIHEAPCQLFDLEVDPGEWTNLSGRPEHAGVEAGLREVVTGGFDIDRIAREVWSRLPMKDVVNRAMARNGTSWDYRPEEDAAARYVRA